MKYYALFRNFLTLLCIVSISGCVGSLPKGIVTDSATGQPVDDAYVIAKFTGDGVYQWPDPGATARNICYGTLITKTNSSGQFDFALQQSYKPTTQDYKRNQKIKLHVYKHGYSMAKRLEISEKVVNMPGTIITPKFIEVDDKDVTFRIDPVSQEELKDRLFFTSLILNNLCKSYSRYHWEMERSILQEIEQIAKVEKDWRDAEKLCKSLNAKNREYKFNKEIFDCDRYHKNVQNARGQYKRQLKRIIDEIDWGDGIKLEYLDLFDQESDNNSTVFLLRHPAGGVGVNKLFDAFKKVCESDFPRNIGEGYVCVIYGEVPEDYRKQGGEICNAFYYGRINKIRIRKGKFAGSALTTETGWCR